MSNLIINILIPIIILGEYTEIPIDFPMASLISPDA